MLYLPNEYSQGVQAENLRVQDGRIALGDKGLGAYRTRRRRVAAAGHHPRLPPSRG